MALTETTEQQRLREKALESEAHTLGRHEANRVRGTLTDALSTRSVQRYNMPAFESLADRDLFLTRFRSTFLEEFDRPL